MKSKIIIAGGGAAGMFASIIAAEHGCEVHVFEKNEKLGKKLFITGKGRCNVTNACDDPELFLGRVVTNRRFLYSAFYGFSNLDMIRFLENHGLTLKVERGQRVFPASDKSSDVIRLLSDLMKEKGVKVYLNTPVRRILTEDGRVCGAELDDGRRESADAVILACGGVSYPQTGSDGDGFRMAGELGHSCTKLSPSLVPLVTQESWCHEIQGLSLKNVTLTLRQGKKQVYQEFGEMMFTHFGITGPIVLGASTCVQKYLKKGYLEARIDLKPALTEKQLDERVLRDFAEVPNRQLRNALDKLLPKSLILPVIEVSGNDAFAVVHDLTKASRLALVHTIKDLPLTVTDTRGFSEAIITQGGIPVKEVMPDSMASRFTKGLYFAGEMLDVDAVTGGYNLQIAWSTAFAAGNAAAEYAYEMREKTGE